MEAINASSSEHGGYARVQPGTMHGSARWSYMGDTRWIRWVLRGCSVFVSLYVRLADKIFTVLVR